MAKKQINHLHKIGVQFCLGELGTNYSTITNLKDLPIQKIKIDRSFIDNLDKSEQNKIIVRSIIDIGKKLGITVCAEGVKTSEQLQILREFECDTA
ncbi:EAL domain-containing protein, partial [Pseudomonas aeruginosa]